MPERRIPTVPMFKKNSREVFWATIRVQRMPFDSMRDSTHFGGPSTRRQRLAQDDNFR